jgi:hypothetical protein
MQIIFDDKNKDRSGDSYRLIRLASSWHVVAHGYLCKVADEDEGRRLITTFATESSQKQPSM